MGVQDPECPFDSLGTSYHSNSYKKDRLSGPPDLRLYRAQGAFQNYNYGLMELSTELSKAVAKVKLKEQIERSLCM